MNSKRKKTLKDQLLPEPSEEEESQIVYGIPIYNRGDDWEETTKIRLKVEKFFETFFTEEKNMEE